MDLVLTWISSASGLLRPHLGSIATIFISTLLVVYGNDINRALKRLMGRRHFALRYMAFILLCSFGYGLLLLFLAPMIAVQLGQVGTHWLAPCVLAIFVGLGILAERKNQI